MKLLADAGFDMKSKIQLQNTTERIPALCSVEYCSTLIILYYQIQYCIIFKLHKISWASQSYVACFEEIYSIFAWQSSNSTTRVHEFLDVDIEHTQAPRGFGHVTQAPRWKVSSQYLRTLHLLRGNLHSLTRIPAAQVPTEKPNSHTSEHVLDELKDSIML